MSLANEARRSVPPFPDPRDTDQGRINRQVVDVIHYLLTRFDQGNIEPRLAALEDIVKEHNDVITG